MGEQNVKINVDEVTHQVFMRSLLREVRALEHMLDKGLVESVLTSGDGRSPETAWVVISVPEEYAILRALRARQVSQTLLEDQRVDAVEVETRNGERVTVYFSPRAHFQRLRRQLDQRHSVRDRLAPDDRRPTPERGLGVGQRVVVVDRYVCGIGGRLVIVPVGE